MRLTTRGIKTAEAIRDRVPFTTSGALRAEALTGAHRWNYGYLNDTERAVWDEDADRIRYVVWSYSTPIAWFTQTGLGEGHWHKVAQKFSMTTSKHQGNLYLIDRCSYNFACEDGTCLDDDCPDKPYRHSIPRYCYEGTVTGSAFCSDHQFEDEN